MQKLLIKFLLRLDNCLYRVISFLAAKAENGLHPKHRLMNYHNFFVENISNQDAILDIGCGNGSLAFDLSKKAKKVIAIDINEKNLNLAKKKYSAPNIEYIIGDAIVYNFTNKIDVIILSNVLEHIEQRINFLKKIKTLAPKLLIRVPMINRNWLTLYKKGMGIDYKLDKTHYIEYTLDTFQKELKETGLNIRQFSIRFGEIWAVAKK